MDDVSGVIDTRLHFVALQGSPFVRRAGKDMLPLQKKHDGSFFKFMHSMFAECSKAVTYRLEQATPTHISGMASTGCRVLHIYSTIASRDSFVTETDDGELKWLSAKKLYELLKHSGKGVGSDITITRATSMHHSVKVQSYHDHGVGGGSDHQMKPTTPTAGMSSPPGTPATPGARKRIDPIERLKKQREKAAEDLKVCQKVLAKALKVLAGPQSELDASARKSAEARVKAARVQIHSLERVLKASNRARDEEDVDTSKREHCHSGERSQTLTLGRRHHVTKGSKARQTKTGAVGIVKSLSGELTEVIVTVEDGVPFDVRHGPVTFETPNEMPIAVILTVPASIMTALSMAFKLAGFHHVITVGLSGDSFGAEPKVMAFTKELYTMIMRGTSLSQIADRLEQGLHSHVHWSIFPDKEEIQRVGLPQTIFGLQAGTPVDCKPRGAPFVLPPPPQWLEGRALDMHIVVSAVLNRRWVAVTGHQGIGKTSIVAAAAHFLRERGTFPGGLYMMDFQTRFPSAESFRAFLSHTMDLRCTDNDSTYSALQHRQLLLILDHTECLSDAQFARVRQFVQGILLRAPGVKVISVGAKGERFMAAQASDDVNSPKDPLPPNPYLKHPMAVPPPVTRYEKEFMIPPIAGLASSDAAKLLLRCVLRKHCADVLREYKDGEALRHSLMGRIELGDAGGVGNTPLALVADASSTPDGAHGRLIRGLMVDRLTHHSLWHHITHPIAIAHAAGHPDLSIDPTEFGISVEDSYAPAWACTHDCLTLPGRQVHSIDVDQQSGWNSRPPTVKGAHTLDTGPKAPEARRLRRSASLVGAADVAAEDVARALQGGREKDHMHDGLTQLMAENSNPDGVFIKSKRLSVSHELANADGALDEDYTTGHTLADLHKAPKKAVAVVVEDEGDLDAEEEEEEVALMHHDGGVEGMQEGHDIHHQHPEDDAEMIDRLKVIVDDRKPPNLIGVSSEVATATRRNHTERVTHGVSNLVCGHIEQSLNKALKVYKSKFLIMDLGKLLFGNAGSSASSAAAVAGAGGGGEDDHHEEEAVQMLLSDILTTLESDYPEAYQLLAFMKSYFTCGCFINDLDAVWGGSGWQAPLGRLLATGLVTRHKIPDNMYELLSEVGVEENVWLKPLSCVKVQNQDDFEFTDTPLSPVFKKSAALNNEAVIIDETPVVEDNKPPMVKYKGTLLQVRWRSEKYSSYTLKADDALKIVDVEPSTKKNCLVTLSDKTCFENPGGWRPRYTEHFSELCVNVFKAMGTPKQKAATSFFLLQERNMRTALMEARHNSVAHTELHRSLPIILLSLYRANDALDLALQQHELWSRPTDQMDVINDILHHNATRLMCYMQVMCPVNNGMQVWPDGVEGQPAQQRALQRAMLSQAPYIPVEEALEMCSTGFSQWRATQKAILRIQTVFRNAYQRKQRQHFRDRGFTRDGGAVKEGLKSKSRLEREQREIAEDLDTKKKATASFMLRRAGLVNNKLYVALQDGEHLTVMTRGKLHLMTGELTKVHKVYTKALEMEDQLVIGPTLLKSYFNGMLGEMALQQHDVKAASRHFSLGFKMISKLKQTNLPLNFGQSKHSKNSFRSRKRVIKGRQGGRSSPDTDTNEEVDGTLAQEYGVEKARDRIIVEQSEMVSPKTYATPLTVPCVHSLILHNLAHTAFLQGEVEKAYQHAEDALKIHTEMRHFLGMANDHLVLGQLDGVKGDWEVGVRHLERARDNFELVFFQRGLAETMRSLGVLHTQSGQYGLAQQCFAHAMTFYRQLGDHTGADQGVSLCTQGTSQVSAMLGHSTEARSLLKDSMDFYFDHDHTRVHPAHGHFYIVLAKAKFGLSSATSGRAAKMWAEEEALEEKLGKLIDLHVPVYFPPTFMHP